MALNLNQKKTIVTKLTDIANQAVSAAVANYRGLTVSEMSELRKMARVQCVMMCVCRNTLARLAFRQTPYACLEKVLIGPIVLFFSRKEPGTVARLIEKFVKDHEHLRVMGLALGNKFLPADQLKVVARLQSHHEILGQLAATMLMPVTKFVYTLNKPVVQVMCAMVAVSAQVRD